MPDPQEDDFSVPEDEKVLDEEDAEPEEGEDIILPEDDEEDEE